MSTFYKTLLVLSFTGAAFVRSSMAANTKLPDSAVEPDSAEPTIAEEYVAAESSPLELRITEYFLDPPGSRDSDQYIEIHGPLRTQLQTAQSPGQFTYLLLKLDSVGNTAGRVDKVVPITGVTLNDNGYAWFYEAGGEGYPAEGGYPTLGTWTISGGTLLLVAVPFGQPLPKTNQNFDGTTQGVARLGGDWQPAWIVLDSVGVISSKKDSSQAQSLYAPVNFAAGDFGAIATPLNAQNMNTDVYEPHESRGSFDEINYVGRRSNGRWFAANLTTRGPEWSTERRNYAISPDNAHLGEPRCVDQRGRVPFKKTYTEITVTLGADAPGCGCAPAAKVTHSRTVAGATTVSAAMP